MERETLGHSGHHKLATSAAPPTRQPEQRRPRTPSRWRRAAAALCLTLISAAWQVIGVPPAVADAAEPGLVGKVIVIDPGHGGPDSGARGPAGLLEKDINLAVALKTAQLLRQMGAVVCLTRDRDTDLATLEDRKRGRRHRTDLAGRLERTLRCDPDAFVSVHCDGAPDPRWHGAHVICLEGHATGKSLADAMQSVFREHLLPTRRAVEQTTTLYLLKRLECPAVFAEIGFITNSDEAAHLASPRYQWRVAQCIAVTLIQYFGQADFGQEAPGSHTTRERVQSDDTVARE